MKGLMLFLLALALLTSCTNPTVPTATARPPTLTPTLPATSTPPHTPSPPPPTATFTPLPPTLTPTPARPTSTTTPAPETVTLELTETELAQSYQAWIEDAGLSIEEVQVTIENEKIQVLLKNVGVPIYMVEEFIMLGTYTPLDGILDFELEKVEPDAPWAWVITPTTKDVMAQITEGIYITELKIVTGKMIIHGFKTAS